MVFLFADGPFQMRLERGVDNEIKRLDHVARVGRNSNDIHVFGSEFFNHRGISTVGVRIQKSSARGEGYPFLM